MKRLAIVTGVLALGALLTMPAPAAAEHDGDRGPSYGRGGGAYDGRGGYGGRAFRYGFDRGFRDGSEEGHKDGRRRRDPRFWRDDDFREADNGYKGWMGPRWDFSAGFREGFAAGYRRAYAAMRPDWRGRWDRYGWRNDREYGRRDERWRDERDWRRERDDDDRRRD